MLSPSTRVVVGRLEARENTESMTSRRALSVPTDVRPDACNTVGTSRIHDRGMFGTARQTIGAPSDLRNASGQIVGSVASMGGGRAP